MKKFKLVIPISRPWRVSLGLMLLAILVLNGASCGGGKKSSSSEEKQDKNIQKKLTDEQMKNVLLKTAEDLGWSETDVKDAGTQGYELKKVYVSEEDKRKFISLAITEVSDSDLSLLIPGANRDTFIEKYCEMITDYQEGRGGKMSSLIEISGFDACHTVEYMNIWKDLKDCLDHSDTMNIIGYYWLQVISTAFDERGEVCEAIDSLPISEVLVNNLLEVF